MSITQQLREDLISLLGDSESSTAMLDILNIADNTLVQLQAAWLPIVQNINLMGNLFQNKAKNFKDLASKILIISNVLDKVEGLLYCTFEDNARLIEELAILNFNLLTYYSIVSNINYNSNYKFVLKCISQIENFIKNNHLLKTKYDAKWHIAIATDALKAFKMGKYTYFPSSCIVHFREAVNIYQNALHCEIYNIDDISLRHTMVSLANVLAQSALEDVVDNNFVTQYSKDTCTEINEILALLTDAVMITSEDATPDLYRRALCFHAKSYVELLSGNFLAATKMIDKTEELINTYNTSQNITAAQSVLIATDVGNFYIAYAAFKTITAKQMAHGQCEYMVKHSDQSMCSISGHKFARVAQIIIRDMDASATVESSKLYTPVFDTSTEAVEIIPHSSDSLVNRLAIT